MENKIIIKAPEPCAVKECKNTPNINISFRETRLWVCREHYKLSKTNPDFFAIDISMIKQKRG